MSEKFQHMLGQFLQSESFDIIQSEFPVMVMFSYNTGLKIIDDYNVEYDNCK